jgi:hypothetical protein
LYADASKYPLTAEAIRGPMNLMTISPQGVGMDGPTAAQQVVNNADTMPQAWMALFIDPTIPNDVGRIHIVHRLTLFAAPMGATQDPAVHNVIYGFDGDLLAGSQVQNVAVPLGTFAPTAILRVPGWDVVNAALTGAAQPIMLGPYTNADHGTELGVTRRICWLPPKYAAMALHLGPTAPMSFLSSVGIAMVNDTAGAIQALLAPCLLWMRAAATRRSPAQSSALAQPYFAIARHHPQLVAFRWSKVEVDLPALGNAPVLMGATHIAQSVGNLANQILVGQRAEADRREEEKVEKRKTAGKKWEANLQPLLNLTHQTTAETLAPVWHKLAESHTKRERNVIQTAVDALARDHTYSPLFITPAFKEVLVGVGSWQTDPYDNDLSRGFTPFAMVAKTSDEEQVDRALIESYDLCMANGTNLTQSEAVHFISQSKIAFPATALHAVETLKNTWVVLAVFLRPSHPLSTELKLLVDWMDRSMLFLQEKQRQHTMPQLFPSLLVYWVHKELGIWLGLQLNSLEHLNGPDFMLLARQIMRSDQWERPLPNKYIETPVQPPPMPFQSPSHENNRSDDSSIVSGLTRQTTGTGSVNTPPEKNRTSGTPMPLSDGDRQTEFDVFRTTTQVSIQKVLKKAADSGSPIPSDTNGVPFCLAYHIRGLCYTNCSRHRGKGSKTQHRAQTPADLGIILPWCAIHWKPV